MDRRFLQQDLPLQELSVDEIRRKITTRRWITFVLLIKCHDLSGKGTSVYNLQSVSWIDLFHKTIKRVNSTYQGIGDAPTTRIWTHVATNEIKMCANPGYAGQESRSENCV